MVHFGLFLSSVECTSRDPNTRLQIWGVTVRHLWHDAVCSSWNVSNKRKCNNAYKKVATHYRGSYVKVTFLLHSLSIQGSVICVIISATGDCCFACIITSTVHGSIIHWRGSFITHTNKQHWIDHLNTFKCGVCRIEKIVGKWDLFIVQMLDPTASRSENQSWIYEYATSHERCKIFVTCIRETVVCKKLS